VLLGHSSIKVTERHYSPWVRARQDQLGGRCNDRLPHVNHLEVLELDGQSLIAVNELLA
jgi:hypothetical protein